MRNYSITSIIIAAIAFSGCAAVKLPQNASVLESGGGTILNRIDLSYATSTTKDFSKVKLCVAENVSNPDVVLQDAAGSFVGSYTKNYYRTNNTQHLSGKGLFKYLDDRNSVLIANGTVSATTGFALVSIIRFEMKVSVSGNKIGMQISNIARAQQNTGTLANDGFGPIWVNPGSDVETIYSVLEMQANAVKACIGG